MANRRRGNTRRWRPSGSAWSNSESRFRRGNGARLILLAGRLLPDLRRVYRNGARFVAINRRGTDPPQLVTRPPDLNLSHPSGALHDSARDSALARNEPPLGRQHFRALRVRAI